jgi:hypothetical protein
MARHERPSDPEHVTVTWSRFGVVWTWVWGGLTLAILFIAVAQWTGLDPAADYEAALGAVMISFLTAAVGVAGALGSRTRSVAPARVRRPPILSSFPPPNIRVEKRPRFPQPKSAARRPMLDLAEAESALAELLRQLRDMPDGPAVPPDVIEHAWDTATGTATRLRSVAARLEAVELATKHAPPREQPTLADGAGSLRLHLEQGLEAYRALIAAAGRVVLAGTPVVATTELVEATESLAGLAEALHELSNPDQTD